MHRINTFFLVYCVCFLDPILCFHFEELNAPDESVNNMLAALCVFSLLLFYNSALILFQEE